MSRSEQDSTLAENWSIRREQRHVSSSIVISPPDENEGNEDVDQDSKDLVRRFWSQMVARYKTEEEYNRQIIDAFKGSGDPEILIVVSKLLTGFDAPRNTVLYVCKSLKEHNLLQAIARVNRLYEDGGTEKQFGFIVDYEGLLGELDSALTTYSAFEGYEAADLAGTVHDVREEIRKLLPVRFRRFSFIDFGAPHRAIRRAKHDPVALLFESHVERVSEIKRLRQARLRCHDVRQKQSIGAQELIVVDLSGAPKQCLCATNDRMHRGHHASLFPCPDSDRAHGPRHRLCKRRFA